jgi:hypothetical protein
MKKIRNLILPVAVLMIGAGAAFATSSQPTADSLVEFGYHYDSNIKRCVVTNVECAITNKPACTWSGQQLYRFDPTQPTMCGVELNLP